MTDTAPPPVTSSPPQLATPKRSFPRIQEMGLIIVVLLLATFLTLMARPVTIGNVFDPTHQIHENGFLRLDNILNSVLTVMTWTAVMSIGQSLVIISGGIDISVGSMYGLSAFVTALVLRNFAYEAPWWQVLPVAILLPLAVGTVCGIINGSLVVGLKMHPFIVTLATMSIFRWVSLKLGFLYGQSQPGNLKLPAAFTDYFMAFPTKRARLGGELTESYYLTPIYVMIVSLALGWIFLRHTIWGRETYAVGGNEEAARFSGIRVKWVKIRVYALCGLCAGIAGMITSGFFKSAQTITGDGMELDVIAAAAVGGASMTGGRGTALGAVLGALVLQLITNGIYALGGINIGFTTIPVVKEDQKFIMGISILIAVAIDQFSMTLQSRRSARLRTAH